MADLGASPVDDLFASAPDRAADMTFVSVSSVVQKFQRSGEHPEKKKNIAVTLWACSTVLQVLVPYGLTDEKA